MKPKQYIQFFLQSCRPKIRLTAKYISHWPVILFVIISLLTCSLLSGGNMQDSLHNNKNMVHDTDSFLAHLAESGRGDTLYIKANAKIDLSGKLNIAIPAGVSIVGLGKDMQDFSDYPLIYTDSVPEKQRINPLLSVAGDDVYVSGIRLRGDYRYDEDEPVAQIPGAAGIRNRGYNDFMMTNCEIYNWHFSGILVDYGSRDNYIRDNYIHSNNSPGYGYGVTVGNNSYAFIEENRFDNNRHSIAGGGCPASGYTARGNIIGKRGTSHSFDMHGGADRGDGTDYAGCCIIIEHNIFYIEDHWAIVIRGIPKERAVIRNNHFHGQRNYVRNSAVKQRNAFGNLYIGPNTFEYDYRQIEEPGWIVLYAAAEEPEWLLHTGYSFDDVCLGDFNGDGVTDIFIIDSRGRWLVSWSALVSWQLLNDTTAKRVAPEDIYIEDFTGDGKDDILFATEVGKYIAVNGSGALTSIDDWPLLDENAMKRIVERDEVEEKMRFLEKYKDKLPFNIYFEGKEINGRTTLDDGAYITQQNVALHDFSGDGERDIFIADGQQWYIYYTEKDSLSLVKESTIPASRLLFGDFNGDGRMDIVYRHQP